MPREKAIKVSSGDVVGLAFVLRDADGEVLTEASPTDPLVLLHGHGFAIAPIHEALEGKEAGDRFELSLDEGAFGHAVADAEQVVPRDRLPRGPLPAGTAVSVMDDDTPRTGWVVRESGAHVVISFSHPWASATRFEAEIVSVRPGTEEEKEAGFATEVSTTEAASGARRATDSDESSDDKSSDDKSSGDKSSGDKSSDDKSSDESSGDDESSDESSGGESSGDNSSGDESSGDNSSGDSSGDKSSGDKSSGDKSSDEEEE